VTPDVERTLVTPPAAGALQARGSAATRLKLASVLAVVFFSFHLPYLPASLEDLDSINFALGVREFDVAQHQPHPPGYPVFIFVAKAANAVAPTEVSALSGVSIVAATLGVLAIAVLFHRLDPDAPAAWWFAATTLAATAPLHWFSAARPLSDAMGLAAALAVQGLALSASIPHVKAVRGESPASHRGRRGAPMTRRDDRAYREYVREEQRSQRGCIAGRMQLEFHHGLLGCSMRAGA